MSEQPLTVIRAGTVVDVVAGETRRAQLIHVRGERIEALAPDAGSYPLDARVIDLSTYSVAPGFIDCHAHM